MINDQISKTINIYFEDSIGFQNFAMEITYMVLEAINATTVQDSVYKQLVTAIMEGKIAPGERITMEGLAKQLNVSIMPVREAIRRLEANKFITIQKRRIEVNKLSVENVNQILEVRLLLEGYAAEKAALQRQDETLDELEDLLNLMENTKDPDIYLKANKQFHNTIYKEGNVPVMLEIIDSLWERYSPYFFILLEDESNWIAPEFFQTHRGMLAGMRRKDPVEVRKWLEKDLTGAAKMLLDLLEKDQAG